MSAAQAVKPCGTRAAYKRHRRNGEEPCEACKKANTAENRDAQQRYNEKRRPCGTSAAYRRHLRAGEEPCALCREAVRKSVQQSRSKKPHRKAPPVKMPEVIQGPAGVGPCAVPENGYLWDPIRENESPGKMHHRHRIAKAICLTSCPVYDRCKAEPPQGAGVVAGVVIPLHPTSKSAAQENELAVV